MPLSELRYSNIARLSDAGSDHDVLPGAKKNEARIKELERIVNELRSHLSRDRTHRTELPGNGLSVQNDIVRSASLSTERKRIHDHIDNFHDEFNFDNTGLIRTEAPSFSLLHAQVALPQPLYNAAKRQDRGSGLPKKDLPWSQFSPSLNLCTKGTCFLPPADEGYSLLSEYLYDFNSIIPLFHPETIYKQIRACYAGEAVDETQRLYWVSTYVTLGIGHRLRAMSLFGSPEDTSNGDFYLNKCLDILQDLLLEEPSLQLIQALLGLSILLQTSYRSQKAALLVATALRMAQDLGYNEVVSENDQESVVGKQGVYLFWIAFSMNTSISLRASRSTTQRVVDIAVPLPNAHAADWWTLGPSDNRCITMKVNIFTLHASLALIQAECSEDLFSVSARRQPPRSTTATFNNLVIRLDSWKRSNPLTTMEASTMLAEMYQSEILHCVILESSYFETLYRLHASKTLGAFTHRLDVFSNTSLKSASARIHFDIFTDAQKLLQMSGLIPQGNLSVTW